MNMNILIAYYSRRGQNYVGGTIEDLRIGNTEVVAQKIERQTGGDMFRIDTVKPYPADYTACTEVARRELHENARPRLADRVDDMQQYDLVFLGYPNWWGTMPMVVHAFLESYDFTGKTIIPFCTHEGSGMGRSVADIRRLCPATAVLDGAAIRGGNAARADEEVRKLVEQAKKQKR